MEAKARVVQSVIGAVRDKMQITRKIRAFQKMTQKLRRMGRAEAGGILVGHCTAQGYRTDFPFVKKV